MTFAEIVERVPDRVPGDGVAWAAYFLRAAFTPIIGYPRARRLVVDVMGPAHDAPGLPGGRFETRVVGDDYGALIHSGRIAAPDYED